MTAPEWFQNLQLRERWVLLGGGLIAVAIIFWQFLWTPLTGATNELRASVATKEQLLIALQRVEAMPDRAGATPVVRVDGTSLLVLVERTQQAHGLAGAFTRTRPEGADGINVTFQNASFDALLAWLITLQAEHGITVESASFNGTRQAGLVSGQLFLRRA
jgi:general secretion pathway protein M